MARRLKKRPAFRSPELTEMQILGWADQYRAQSGRWPTRESGRIQGSLGEKWGAVNAALWQGNRGLPKGGSLARLLAKHRGVRNRSALPELDVDQILAWADAHFCRTGAWPTSISGPVTDAPGETWRAVDKALSNKTRGIRKRSSLAKLLARRRHRRHKGELPAFKEEQILIWAEAHKTLFGVYPTTYSGPVGNTGETWRRVDFALRRGMRGLPGNDSLLRLLQRTGKVLGLRTSYHRRGNTRRPNNVLARENPRTG
jgi:hypothetical protein